MVFILHSNLSSSNSNVIVIQLKSLKSLYDCSSLKLKSKVHTRACTVGHPSEGALINLTHSLPLSVTLSLAHSFNSCQWYYFLCLIKLLYLQFLVFYTVIFSTHLRHKKKKRKCWKDQVTKCNLDEEIINEGNHRKLRSDTYCLTDISK